jgi:hypothetical protein
MEFTDDRGLSDLNPDVSSDNRWEAEWMERLVRVSDTKLLRGDFRVSLDLPYLLPALEPEARAWTWTVSGCPTI